MPNFKFKISVTVDADLQPELYKALCSLPCRKRADRLRGLADKGLSTYKPNNLERDKMQRKRTLVSAEIPTNDKADDHEMDRFLFKENCVF